MQSLITNRDKLKGDDGLSEKYPRERNINR